MGSVLLITFEVFVLHKSDPLCSKVYEFEQRPQLLVGSGGDVNYIPGIPGQQPEDDKHLA